MSTITLQVAPGQRWRLKEQDDQRGYSCWHVNGHAFVRMYYGTTATVKVATICGCVYLEDDHGRRIQTEAWRLVERWELVSWQGS